MFKSYGTKTLYLPWQDVIHTDQFTPKPFQVDLLERALLGNRIVCINSDRDKSFIVVKLTQELSIRGKLKKKIAFLVSPSLPSLEKFKSSFQTGSSFKNIHIVTDIAHLKSLGDSADVILTLPDVIADIFFSNPDLDISTCGLLIFDEFDSDKTMRILEFIEEKCDQTGLDKPHILGLSTSILKTNCSADDLRSDIHELEDVSGCKVETSTEYATTSIFDEKIIICDEYENNLKSDIRDAIQGPLTFLKTCMGEKLVNLPEDFVELENCEPLSTQRNPITLPLYYLCEIQKLLDKLGPWAVYRHYQTNIRAVQRQMKLESRPMYKLLLEMLATTMRKIFMICDETIRTTGFDRSLLATKVNRLLDILRESKPEVIEKEEINYNNRNDSNYVSWYKEEGEDCLNDLDPQVPTPFTNKLWGCLLVNDRSVARYLVKIVKDAGRNDPDLSHICAQALCQITRLETSEEASQLMTEERKKQEEALHKFRTREANLLIAQAETEASNEKSFDIPRCNLVLRFDPPSTYIKYDNGKRLLSQSQDSLHGILVDKKDKQKFTEKLHNFKTLEEYLIKRNDTSEEAGPLELCMDLLNDENGELKTDHEIVIDDLSKMNLAELPEDAGVLDDEDEEEMNGKEGRVWRRRERPLLELKMENTMALLNKYCNRLPCDTFTQLSVLKKTVQLSNGKFITSLVLPNNSHLRGLIQGSPQDTEELSKQSSALVACRRLREAGELDDFLFHTGKEAEKYRLETDPFPVIKDFQKQKNKIPGPEGGPKRRQLYHRYIPKCFRQKSKGETDQSSGLPLPEKPVYVYRISMYFRLGIQDKYNYRGRRLHRPEDHSRSFGIISGQPIPHTLPSFSVFDRSGEEGVKIEPVFYKTSFSKSQIEMFRNFHQFIFQDVIRIERPGGSVQFNPEKSPLPYLIVPLDCDNGTNWDIDWSFLVTSLADRVRCEKAHAFDRRVRVFDEKRPYQFDKTEIHDAVVITSYRRHDAPTQNRFYVAEIQYDMDPDSPFPSEEYSSFRSYYMKRWNLLLTCDKQPLLDVDHTDARLNLLTPRFVSQKGRALPASTLEKKRLKYENKANRQYLIPEILDIHPIPSSLWRKAVCLPSILHRITCLLAAEDLRRRIAEQTKVGIIIPPLGYFFPHLRMDWDDETEKGLEPFDVEPDLPANYPYKDRIEDQNEPKDNRSIETHPLEIEQRGPLVDIMIETKSIIEYKNTKPGLAPLLTISTRQKPIKDIESVGPTPDEILQTLTLSKASDGFNLERLEMLGDCFLKYAVTVYLYCVFEGQHEGQLSYLRSKKVSNKNLYRLGVYNDLPGRMVSEQFALNDTGGNWLPPGYYNKDHDERGASEDDDSDDLFKVENWKSEGNQKQENEISEEEEDEAQYDNEDITMIDSMFSSTQNGVMCFLDKKKQLPGDEFDISVWKPLDTKGKPINQDEPLIYNHYSDQWLTDKSIADCMEALIGAYLTASGIEATQLFLCHMGLTVLPTEKKDPETGKPLPPFLPLYPPVEPFHFASVNSKVEQHQRQNAVNKLTANYHEFEERIGYKFNNIAYLLQALTHASYQYNQVTNCYQRLEFLGDAVLDFLITRHLFDHPSRRFTPGELTDLRAALVNNNIFAALAVKYWYHKYLHTLTPDLHNVIRDYVLYCETQDDVEGMEAALTKELEDEDDDDSEDIEVPKVLGDIYESVAGAIYLDSGMDLNTVWQVYHPMLKRYIEKYSIQPPRSPIRELLEMEPETAKFSTPEKRADGKYRVTVEIANKGKFAGAGRNQKSAKASAARAALSFIKKQRAEMEDGIDD